MKSILTAVIILITTLVCSVVIAQTGESESKPETTIGLEFTKPFLVEENRTSFATFAGVFKVSTRISDHSHLVLDIPFTKVSFKGQSGYYENGYGYTRAADNNIGNPYIGFEFSGPNSSATTVSLGVRVPITSDDNWYATTIGELAAPEQIGAYWDDIYTISAVVNYSRTQSNNPYHRFSFGLTGLVPNADSYMDLELITTYGYQLGLPVYPLIIKAGLSGFLILTADNGALNEISHNFMHLDIGHNRGDFRPELKFSLPLNGYYSESTNYTIGLSLNYIIDNN